MLKKTENSHIFIYDDVMKIYPVEYIRPDKDNRPLIPDEAYTDVKNHDWLQYAENIRHTENRFIEAAEIYWQAAFDECDSDEAFARLEKSSIQLLASKSAFLASVKNEGLLWSELRFYLKDKKSEIMNETRNQLDAIIYENNKKLYDLIIKYGITERYEAGGIPAKPNLYNEVTSW